MQARSLEPRSTGDLIRQAIRIVVVTLVSAAVLVVIGNKIRTTWGVLNTIERRVDGMIASAVDHDAAHRFDDVRAA